ncbi:MAG: hypothetical protein LBT05_16505 [Planctomycetaceae bacterium]|jgi:hypothetical protein|nr:hypothetical protein [Planctomycetaceae bacterium]
MIRSSPKFSKITQKIPKTLGISRFYNRQSAFFIFVPLLLSLEIFSGCTATKMLERRPHSQNPLVIRFQPDAVSSPKMSSRARLTLRSYALEELANTDRLAVAGKLHKLIKKRQTDPNLISTFAEMTYLEGYRHKQLNPRLAAELFAASILYSYIYLFDPQYDFARNPYDPQFRDVCLFYNGSLEQILRLIGKNNTFYLDTKNDYVLKTVENDWNLSVKIRAGKWNMDEIETFRFAFDYEIHGMQSQYRQFGLGVPLIACRKGFQSDDSSGGNKESFVNNPISHYYPNHMALPATAFLRPNIRAIYEGNHEELQAELEFYDPLESDKTVVEGRFVPLETDLTTPLAYFLSNRIYMTVGKIGVLDPAKLLEELPGRNRPIVGLYMAQPYDPNKIPVVMVHGLFSLPLTWLEMLNALQNDPKLRDKYQFWFYLYPSGQPFWVSAAQMRRELREIRDAIDPRRAEPALDQMVLIGHSMGGLISLLQTVESGDQFWRLISKTPFEDIRGDAATKKAIQEWFFFRPNPSIKQVVTIATPFRGSKYSNEATQWLTRSVSAVPKQLAHVLQTFSLEQRNKIDNFSLLNVANGVESLSPKSPFFEPLIEAPRAEWVEYHNIIGEIQRNYPTFGLKIPESDGVVRTSSAEADWASSKAIVPASHTKVHMHPNAILEVRRILRDFQHQLAERQIQQQMQREQYSSQPPPILIPQYATPYY